MLDLDAIEAGARRAAGDPWMAVGTEVREVWHKPREGPLVATAVSPQTAFFIASARSDVPAMAKEIRRLRLLAAGALSDLGPFAGDDRGRDAARTRLLEMLPY